MVLPQYDTGAWGLWLGLSDNRPVVAAYGGLLASGSRPRFTNVFSQARSLHLNCFLPSVKQLRDYQAGLLDTTWVRMEGPPPSLAQAEAQLRHLTNISLESSPPLKEWQVRNKYKERWSPTYAALQAQLQAIILSQRYLGVIPLSWRLSPWSTAHGIQQDVADTVQEWECTVASLTFHGDTLSEVWSIGLTPR